MDITCAICLESFTSNCEVSSTPCGHLFHSKCLSRAISRTQNTCPTCRTDCGEKIRKVYLQSASSIPETAQQRIQQCAQGGAIKQENIAGLSALHSAQQIPCQTAQQSAQPNAKQSTRQRHFPWQTAQQGAQPNAKQSARQRHFPWQTAQQSAQQRAEQSVQQVARQRSQQNLEQRLEAGGWNPENILGPSALELARQIARSQLTLSSVSTQQSAQQSAQQTTQQSAQDSDVQPAQQFLFDNNGQVIHPIQRTVQQYNKIFSKKKQQQEQKIKQQEQKRQQELERKQQEQEQKRQQEQLEEILQQQQHQQQQPVQRTDEWVRTHFSNLPDYPNRQREGGYFLRFFRRLYARFNCINCL